MPNHLRPPLSSINKKKTKKQKKKKQSKLATQERSKKLAKSSPNNIPLSLSSISKKKRKKQKKKNSPTQVTQEWSKKLAELATRSQKRFTEEKLPKDVNLRNRCVTNALIDNEHIKEALRQMAMRKEVPIGRDDFFWSMSVNYKIADNELLDETWKALVNSAAVRAVVSGMIDRIVKNTPTEKRKVKI